MFGSEGKRKSPDEMKEQMVQSVINMGKSVVGMAGNTFKDFFTAYNRVQSGEKMYKDDLKGISTYLIPE